MPVRFMNSQPFPTMTVALQYSVPPSTGILIREYISNSWREKIPDFRRVVFRTCSDGGLPPENIRGSISLSVGVTVFSL